MGYKIFGAILVSVVVLILVAGIAIIFFDHGVTGSWTCGYTETSSTIPDYLAGSQIIFEKPVYAGKNLDLGYGCVDAYSENNHVINEIFPYPSSLEPLQVSSGTVFTINKNIDVTCAALTCMDAGGGGRLWLLRDDQGTLWTVNSDFFNAKYYSGQFLFGAGYYRNGQRLGTVTSESNSAASSTNIR